MLINTYFTIISIFLLYFTEISLCRKICNKRSPCKHGNGGNSGDSGDKLLMTHTICRHGDRNIYAWIAPSTEIDPWSPEKYWPNGYAQITKVGIKQHYELGKYFRKRYASLLGSGSYKRNRTYIRSTDVDRVLMSAEANLAGLYPPSGRQIWNNKINWQPVPVHTQPRDEDYLLAADRRCDRFDYFMLQYMNTTAYTDFFTKYSSLINYLEIKTATRLRTITDMTNVYDTFFIERLKGKRLPDWAEEVMVPGGEFEYLAFAWYIIFTQTTEQKKLKSGWLLKEILDRCTSKTQMTLSPDRSIWMYFAHDITIANMLNSLGVYEPVSVPPPPYASCLLFELYEGNGNPYLQLFYRKYLEDNYPKPIYIPECGTKCPLEKWYQRFDEILTTQNFEDECRLRQGETLPAGGNPENNSL